ncbi:MAG: hypothetical protein R3Y50_05220 [Rikenellaceae bacterium]
MENKNFKQKKMKNRKFESLQVDFLPETEINQSQFNQQEEQEQLEEQLEEHIDELSEEAMLNDDEVVFTFIELLKKFLLETGCECDLEDKIALFSTILQKLENDHLSCIELSRQNQVIAQTIADNPRLMILIQELMDGTPIRIALVKSDLVDVHPSADDEEYEAYNMAVAQAREQRNRAKYQAIKRKENCEQCRNVANEFYADMEISDEEVAEFVKFLDGVIDAIFEAHIDRELLEVMWKAYSFDKEVRFAKTRGVVEGKNIAIEAFKRRKKEGISKFASQDNKTTIVKEGYIERLMKQQFPSR